MLNSAKNGLLFLYLCQVMLILATIGAFMQVAGANWDITLHITREGEREGDRLLVDAESFLSESHTVLYVGVALTSIAAGLGVFLITKYNNEVRNKSFATAFKLLALGCGLQLIAGPFDLWWHATLGLDGLLSPPHLLLITGMFVNGIAVTLGLARVTPYISDLLKNSKNLIRIAMIPAFATLWLSSTWLVYAFVLPLSHGQRFDFNMNPVAAAIIATLALPLIGSIVFVTSSRVIGRFGGASAVALLVISTNVFANILPSTQLTLFLPWYITLLVPAIISDILLNKRRRAHTAIFSRKAQLIVGAMIGSIFYTINFPMLSLTFSALYGYPIPTIVQNEMSNFLHTLPSVVAVTLVPGAVIGIIGAVFVSRKISIPSRSLFSMDNMLKDS